MLGVTAAAVMLIYTNGGASGHVAPPSIAYFATMDDCEFAKSMVKIDVALSGFEASVLCLPTGARK